MLESLLLLAVNETTHQGVRGLHPTVVASVGLIGQARVMTKVTGIGGLFFRAKDPAALGRWYERNLGVDPMPADHGQAPWSQQAGPTVLAPFAEDSKYFGAPDKHWMINFRVSDLDAMVEQLRAAGIEIAVDDQVHPNGRFARLHDPEGNPIELWQPA